jgi:hypothetical protein
VPVTVAADAVRAPIALCANPACQAALRWAADLGDAEGQWRIDTNFESRRSYLRFHQQHAHVG